MTPEFGLEAGAYRYRTLERDCRGWDVFALQTTLAGIETIDLELDGVFGKRTERKVGEFQDARGLHRDGRAGPATQRKAAEVLGRKFRKGWGLPNGIPFGHIEGESGCLLGNHTAPYSNGSRDLGLVQRNDEYVSTTEGFDAPDSLFDLCQRITTTRDRYIVYEVVSERRALELACGHWNRPAYTDALAKGQTSVLIGGTRVDLNPGSFAREWIEAYIAKVTKYLEPEN